jgi:hypothetical protein
VSEEGSELEFIGFRAEASLDQDLRNLAYENKMTKSELLRQICEYGVEHINQIVDGEAEPTDA